MSEWVSIVVSSDATDHAYILEEEGPSIANHIQNNTALDTNHDDFGVLPFEGGDTEGQRDFVERALEWVDDNNITVSDENIIIGHSVESWGYGVGHIEYTSSNGHKIWGCAVYIGTTIQDWEKRQMTWHEAGHNWGADHRHGHYYDNGWQLKQIKPMGSAYTYDSDGDVDMPWAGSGDIPDQFCDELSNYTNSEAYSDESNHEMGYSNCTLDMIESFFGY